MTMTPPPSKSSNRGLVLSSSFVVIIVLLTISQSFVTVLATTTTPRNNNNNVIGYSKNNASINNNHRPISSIRSMIVDNKQQQRRKRDPFFDASNKEVLLPSTTNDEEECKNEMICRRRRQQQQEEGGKKIISSSSLLSSQRGGAAAVEGGLIGDLLGRLKIASYFALWYALNVVYNIVNKKVLNIIPAPITIGTLQFGIGALYSLLLWLLHLRPTPTLTPYGRSLTAKIGFYHMSGQLLSMISLGAGPVSFTHIVKALEPFFSAVVSAVMFRKWMAWQVYTTLLPVVGGVGYACLKERSFSWVSFYAAMGSNVAFALRAVVSKAGMMGGSGVGENLSPANLFGVVTIFAFLMSVPAVFVGEGLSFVRLWKTAVTATTGEDGGAVVTPAAVTSIQLIRAVIISGVFHYLNNEVMYLALSNVHPVTLAVGNTMKRVFIMVASVLVFKNEISVQAGIGSAIGIGGVLLYSLTKQYYEKLEQEKANKDKEGKK